MSVLSFLTAFRCPLCMRSIGYKSRKILELIKSKEWYLKERESLIQKREDLLEKEREAIIGKDAADIKRTVLLRSMQRKWDAEKKLLDAQTFNIINKTPAVKVSLDSRKTELGMALNNVKQKPSTAFNHDLRIQYESRLEELNFVINNIARAKSDEPKT